MLPSPAFCHIQRLVGGAKRCVLCVCSSAVTCVVVGLLFLLLSAFNFASLRRRNVSCAALSSLLLLSAASACASAAFCCLLLPSAAFCLLLPSAAFCCLLLPHDFKFADGPLHTSYGRYSETQSQKRQVTAQIATKPKADHGDRTAGVASI